MRKIKLDVVKTVGVSESGRRVGIEKTGTTEKDLVEAPARKRTSAPVRSDTGSR